MYDLIGSRSNLATPQQKKLSRQIGYYRKKLMDTPEFRKSELEMHGFNTIAGIYSYR